MSNAADNAIVSSLARGDATAFDEVVRSHSQAVYGFIRSRVLAPPEAENLTRQVFEDAYSHRTRFHRDAELRLWLMEHARELVTEHMRGHRRHTHANWTALCLDLVDAPAAINEDEVRSFRECLDGLAPSAREALGLKYRENRRASEIANRLRRSEDAVKLLLFRSRQSLRHCMEQNAGAVTSDSR